MPDDLRWSWCNNNWNKVHKKCNAVESSRNHPPFPSPWKNCLPWNWSLMPKRLGTTALKIRTVLGTVLEAGSSNSRCQRGWFLLGLWGRICPMSLSWLLMVFWPSLVFLGFCHVTSLSAFIFTWHSSCTHVCVQPPFLIRMLLIVNLDPPQWPHLNLITSVKTLFPNKVTVWDAGG